MEKNKVTVTIRSQQYTIVSSEPPEKIKALAFTVDEKLSQILSSSKVTLSEALVLTALDLANEASDQERTVIRLKREMAGYLEDVEKAAMERDKYKRELDKLKGKK